MEQPTSFPASVALWTPSREKMSGEVTPYRAENGGIGLRARWLIPDPSSPRRNRCRSTTIAGRHTHFPV